MIFFIKRLLRRAAVFLCKMPLAAAMSMRLTARRTSSAFSGVPMLARADFMRVFNSLLTALLRSADLALVRLRFF